MHDAVIETARKAALRAADVVISNFTTARVEEKTSNNLVTQADFEAQREIISVIKAVFPHHSILGEEGQQDAALDADNLWIVDPLDGTNNYAHGIPHFGVSIAYAQYGRVLAGTVYDPMRREMFHAAEGRGSFLNGAPIAVSTVADLQHAIVATGFHYDRGILMERTLQSLHALFKENIQGVRRMGSAALDLCWVASGRFDAYFEYRLSPWDFAGGMLIVREAGGVCLDRMGGELSLDSEGVIACIPGLRAAFLDKVLWRG